MEHPFLMFLDHTQRRTTVGRTPLDEWSACHRDLYLTAHNTHNRQISMPPVGLEPTTALLYTRWNVQICRRGIISVDFLVDIEWSNVSATMHDKAFIFFENSPETSLNFAYEIGILFRLLLLRPWLPCFPSNSCGCVFSFTYLCHHRRLTLFCTSLVIILRSTFMAYLHVNDGKFRVLFPVAYCLPYPFLTLFIYLLSIFCPPYLNYLLSYVFLKICVSFHNMSFSLAATISLNLSSFSPLHVYSSHFFPDSLRYIIHVSECSSLGSVPSSFGSPSTVRCLLSALRLHGNSLLLISAWSKSRCCISLFNYTQICMENIDKWRGRRLVWMLKCLFLT